ncbi:MAG: PilZ domain-containing protein, partial [Sulfuricaulis sp.]|nr:PilZ domain-containing protein [Sulfuricaulis sp.]
MTEKRRYRRSNIQLDIELIYPDGGSSRVKTRDLSIGGLFVEAIGNQPPKLGTLLTVSFLSAPHQGGTYSL